MRSCVLLATLLAFCAAAWGQGKIMIIYIAQLVKARKKPLANVTKEQLTWRINIQCAQRADRWHWLHLQPVRRGYAYVLDLGSVCIQVTAASMYFGCFVCPTYLECVRLCTSKLQCYKARSLQCKCTDHFQPVFVISDGMLTIYVFVGVFLL